MERDGQETETDRHQYRQRDRWKDEDRTMNCEKETYAQEVRQELRQTDSETKRRTERVRQ